MRSVNFPRRFFLILAVFAALGVVGYLLASRALFRIGFPLDDAWIHQTYARNLALRGEWAFWSGHAAGGSTAPLWSALLALGYWLKLSPYLWAFGLGALILWGIALLGEGWVRAAVPAYRSRFPWVGLFLIGEWHLLWASASGMETLLYALLVTIVLALLSLGYRNYLGLGALIGLSVWIRPDGVTLLGPVVLVALLDDGSWLQRLRYLVNVGLSFGVFLTFYLFFNLILTGTPWPNTFYAKQAEYAILLQSAPLWKRFLGEVTLPLIGAGALLFPGFLLRLWQVIQKRDVAILAGMIWFFGYVGLYAVRLPVTYQHGRYIMPAMPIFFTWGLMGCASFFSLTAYSSWQRVLRSAWLVSLGVVWFGFLLLGAKAYAEDVAIIESEMVTSAQWAAENIPEDELLAAHDIGALGYFADREIVDLAGLVSPEVIPFIREEAQLAAYLDRRDVSYLITFPLWYESLPEGRSIVYNSEGIFAPFLGGENMVIYRWKTR